MRSLTRQGMASLGTGASITALFVLTTGCASIGPSPPRQEPGVTPEARPSPKGRGETTVDPVRVLADRIAARARQLVASPYRYRGNDPRGFDCSGFTEFVFASAGLTLPRTAAQQARAGEWVPPDELRTGDLVFFGDRRGKPFHVGLVSSALDEPLRMIHASTSRGVIETEILSSAYWLERLLFGRRLLGSR